MRPLLPLFFILAVLSSAHAQETDASHVVVDGEPLIITLRMGAPAPWTGTLLSNEAAAEIISTNDAQARECEANIRHEVKNVENICSLNTKVLQDELKGLNKYYQSVIDAKDKHINSLVSIKNPLPPPEKKFYETPVAFFTYGILAGAALTLSVLHFRSN